MKEKKKMAIFGIALLVMLLSNPIPVNAWVYPDCTQDDNVEFFGPRADKILIKFYDDEIIEATALEEGKIDFTDWPVTSDYVTKWSQPPWSDKIKLVWRGTEFGMFVLDLNNNPNPYLGNPQNPAYPNPVYPNPMSDVWLRRAVAHCIDKDYIVTTICGGFAERLDNYVPSSYGVWSNPAVPIYPFDPVKAAQILDENGFPLGGAGGKRYWDRNCNGFYDGPTEDFTLKFYIRSDHVLRSEAGTIIYNVMKDPPVSLPVDAIYMCLMGCRMKVMTEKDFHLYTGGWGLSADPDQGYFLYHIDMYRHPGRPINYDAVNISDHNYWSRKFVTSMNSQDALDACYKAQEAFCRDVGAIPLWASAGYTAYRRCYTGGTNEVPVGDGEDIYRGLPWTHVINEKGLGTWSYYTFLNAYPEPCEFGDDENMTIRWGFRVPYIASLNPIYAESYDLPNWNILRMSYDSLIALNPNTLEDEPRIANSWEIGTWIPTAGPLAGQELSKVTFYLGAGQGWSDGVPLTAEDVKFTLGGPLEVGSLSWWLKQRGLPPASWSGQIAHILSVSTPDPWTVEVLLDTTSYFAHHAMSGWNIILPKHIWEPIVNDKTGDSPYGDDPTAYALLFGSPRVCTGPWIIGSYTGVEPSITLYENPLRESNQTIWGSPIPEDITGTKVGNCPAPDLIVDMKDVAIVARAFGSYPGHPRWNNIADINKDYKVDMKDVGPIAKKFGWKAEFTHELNIEVDYLEGYEQTGKVLAQISKHFGETTKTTNKVRVKFYYYGDFGGGSKITRKGLLKKAKEIEGVDPDSATLLREIAKRKPFGRIYYDPTDPNDEYKAIDKYYNKNSKGMDQFHLKWKYVLYGCLNLANQYSMGRTTITLDEDGGNYVFICMKVIKDAIEAARKDFPSAIIMEGEMKGLMHEIGHTIGMEHQNDPQCVMIQGLGKGGYEKLDGQLNEEYSTEAWNTANMDYYKI